MTLLDDPYTQPGVAHTVTTYVPAAGQSSPSDIKRRYTNRMRRADFLTIIVYFSVAVVLALFLADKGMTYFSSPAKAITGVGIIAGLVGTDLLLVMLLLAARLPILDRTFGHDKALAMHRKLGKPVFYLIIAHMLLLLIGYGVQAGINPIAQAITFLGSGNDMILAFVATAAMTIVVVTSLVIVRRKLAYEFWYVVHLLSYVAVLAALPHQFSTGMLFAEGTWARPYWLALIILSLGSILIFRFLVPVVRSFRHRLVVSDVRLEAPDVATITLSGRDLHKLRAKGGQFMNWRFWAPGLALKSNPFSFSAAPNGRTLRITVRDLGAQTHRLMTMRPGTPVTFEGPYGMLTEASRTTHSAVLIGSGIGITPIRALLEDPRFGAANITVILRGSTEENVYLWNEVYDLCVAKNVALRVLVGHRPRGVETWLSAESFNRGDRLATLAPNVKEADVFICGPTAWMDLVARDAHRAGVPSHRIHLERFDF